MSASARFTLPSASRSSTLAGMLSQISSVTNGISGCIRRMEVSSTKIRLRCACRRPSPFRRALVTSTYQSQTSFQKNCCTPRAISPKV